MDAYIYIRVIYINIYIYTRARRGETIREKRGSGQKNDQRRTESERKGEKEKWEYHSCTRMRTSGRQKEDSRLEREEKEREEEEK